MLDGLQANRHLQISAGRKLTFFTNKVLFKSPQFKKIFFCCIWYCLRVFFKGFLFTDPHSDTFVIMAASGRVGVIFTGKEYSSVELQY